MKKILFLALTMLATGLMLNAQDPDLAAISQMRKIKSDSLSTMLGKVYATKSAMNHTGAEARTALLMAFNEALNIDKQDESYREGNSLASEFFKVAEDMKNRNGIIMDRKAFAQAFMTRYNDTTATVSVNDEVRAINTEAKQLIDGLNALLKDSTAAITKADVIAIKSDSLSQNMGRFYGLQVQNSIKRRNLTDEQKARLFEGFNAGINIDESNLPLIDGRLLANDFLNMEKSIKKQLNLSLSKDLFKDAVIAVMSDPKVPTNEEFKAVDAQTQAYIRETQDFARENSAEALTQKGLGKKYIENLMEKDPAFIQAPSGLVYKIINPGNGNKFGENDKIRVMYKGTHVDGKTFDESKEPVTFAPNQVVPGFREALLMMSPGAKMTAVLPYEIAYGARGAGQSIKPFETLVFDIETLGLDENEQNKEVGKATPTPSKAEAKPAVKTESATPAKEKVATAKTGTKAKKTSKKTSKKRK